MPVSNAAWMLPNAAPRREERQAADDHHEPGQEYAPVVDPIRQGYQERARAQDHDPERDEEDFLRHHGGSRRAYSAAKLVIRAVTRPVGSSAPVRESPVPVETAEARQAERKFDEQNAIIRMLRNTTGRVGGPNGAAARTGLKRTTLIMRMKKLGIESRGMF
jgi:transcriptional regulator with GAF, ATPase, and Fis domain